MSRSLDELADATPARLAIAIEKPRLVMAKQRALLRQVLKQEAEIYHHVGQFYALSCLLKIAKETVFDLVCLTLHDKAVIDGDLEAFKNATRPVYNIYWEIADEHALQNGWQHINRLTAPTASARHELPVYGDMLIRWRQLKHERLEAAETALHEFREIIEQ